MSIIGQDFSLFSEQNDPKHLQTDGEFNRYEFAQQARFNAVRRETQDITLTTEEGDTISINAASLFQAAYMGFDYAEQVKGEQTAFQMEKLSASIENQFDITVQGDLNEEEQADLQEILGKLDDIMDDLVQGDIEGIMAEVPGLLDDADSITGLQAVLRFEQQVSVEQRTMVRMEGNGQLPEMPQHEPLFGGELVTKIADRVMELFEASSIDPEKLKEPTNDYFKELMNKISFDRGENHPMLDLTDQLNAELLNRLSPPTDDTV